MPAAAIPAVLISLRRCRSCIRVLISHPWGSAHGPRNSWSMTCTCCRNWTSPASQSPATHAKARWQRSPPRRTHPHSTGRPNQPRAHLRLSPARTRRVGPVNEVSQDSGSPCDRSVPPRLDCGRDARSRVSSTPDRLPTAFHHESRERLPAWRRPRDEISCGSASHCIRPSAFL